MTVARTAVVIPVHNGWEFTRLCLAELNALECPPDLTVVVDDGSTDDTAERLRFSGGVDVVTGDGTLWWTGAVEAGTRLAFERGADVVVLLNNDNVAMSPNLVSELATLARRRNACVAALVYRRESTGHESLFNAGGSLAWSRRGIGLVSTPPAAISEVEWLPGCALAFTRELHHAIGGFDRERFPQYRGDIDFTLRARKAGFECLVTPSAWVVNDATQTGFRLDRRITFRQAIEGLTSRRSNYNLREVVPFAWRHCPRRWFLFHLAQLYARYVYACGRSRFRPQGRSAVT